MTRRIQKTRRTRKTRKARRAGSGQADVDSVLSQKFRPTLTRGIGRRNLVNPHVGFSGNNNKGYGFTRNEISKEGTPNNILNAEYLAESRIDNTPTTPMVTKNVFSLTSAEAHKYAKLYQKYVRNNDAGADERFFNAIRKDNSLTNDSKAKLIKHFLASLEKGSELNIKFGILRLYKYANDLELM